MMFSRVVLPLPEGPMIATNSPGTYVQRDAVERWVLDLADHVLLPHVLRFDEVLRGAHVIPGVWLRDLT
jgi:hypothetical protein